MKHMKHMRPGLILMVFALTLFLFFNQVSIAKKADLLLYLPFNEGKGDVAKDASGNGNDGKLIGGPKWVAGKVGIALEFQANTYVEVADKKGSGLDGVDGLTVEAWVKQSTHHDNGIVVKLTTAAFWPNSYNLETWSDQNLWFGVEHEPKAISAPGYPLNDWFHFSGVFDGKAKKQYIYLNGKEVAKGDVPSSVVPDGDKPVWIGTVDPSNFFFRGILDEIAIYKRALVAAEIQQDMNQGVDPGASAVQKHGKLAVTWGKIKTGVF